MKLFRAIMAATSLVILFMSIGCFTIYKDPGVGPSSQVRPEDQFVYEWQMERTGVSPKLPFPDIVLNQIVPDKATWKISRQNNQMRIQYDGSDTWYRTLGLDIKKNPVQVAEDAAKATVTFTGGGSINFGSLPLILAAVFQRKMEQFTITFTESNVVKLTSPTKISSSITYQVQGKYLGDMETSSQMIWKTFNQSGSFTYVGTRK